MRRSESGAASRYSIVTARDTKSAASQVLELLHAEWVGLSKPDTHTWHNSQLIFESFKQHPSKLVQSRGKLLAFIIYTKPDQHARSEILFVHVFREYRKKGIFKYLLTQLPRIEPNIAFFAANVSPGLTEPYGIPVVKVYQHLGFSRIQDRLYIKSVTAPVKGEAVCPKEGLAFFVEKAKRFYSLPVTPSAELINPICMPLSPSALITVYYNTEIVLRNHAKYIFGKPAFYQTLPFLALASLSSTTAHNAEFLQAIKNEIARVGKPQKRKRTSSSDGSKNGASQLGLLANRTASGETHSRAESAAPSV